MTFNSVFFVAVFLPAVLALYYACVRFLPDYVRLVVLIVVGLAFYGRSQAYYVPLLLGSAIFNYALAMGISRWRESPHIRNPLVLAGVVFDIGLLLYFKYFGAIFNTMMVALRGGGDVLDIITPLAISFYTFQQVAFLLDVARGRTEPESLVRYLAFISFFPQLLAGPISLHQEVAPQLERRPPRGRAFENILIGVAIFSIGLFKKTVIADTAALWADPVFDAAATGSSPGFFTAWAGAITYTLQIYFDFSGYSDMAIGVARMFGILLPLNFFSPFRSRSIAELWQRWHMTLGRWVRIYIFQPMAVPLTRLAANLELGKWGSHAISTLVPTFLSMLIIGTWHGPNWTFVMFGVLHGTFMCINEIYSLAMRKRRRKKPASQARLSMYTFLTVLAFTIAEVPFRAVDVPTAMRIFAGMAGMNGSGFAPGTWLTVSGVGNLLVVAICLLVVYLMPNTQQVMARFRPALDWDKWGKLSPAPVRAEFSLTSAWLACIALLLFLGLTFISRGTPKFIYFNF